MAIRKKIEQESGAKVDYWRVNAITADLDAGYVAYTVVGYLTETARKAGKNPAAGPRRFEFIEPGGAIKAGTELVKLCYEHLKTVKEFEGGEDV